MDDGSSLTLLEEEVAERLGVTGISDPLCMRWTGDVVRFEDASRKFDLKISAKHSSTIYPLKNVHTVKSLNLSPETLLLSDIKQKYPYLADIPLEEYESAVPSMIIGINNPNLISYSKTREGKWHQPVAAKTRLGWTLFGGSSMVKTLNLHSCACTKDEQLHEVVKQFFLGESDSALSTSLRMSTDDERALHIMAETCTFIDGQYEVGLLWKEENPVLPNSLPTAIKRLNCIKKKARNDSKIAEVLQKQIESLVEKGYAQKLSSNVMERNGDKVWYLPTFIVRNPHKPSKIRLVWDAAAKTEDVSLNDFLLKGPDLLRPLMHIMFKFRMGAIAVCGDIAEMFHRIGVRKTDDCAQRFLWWDSQNPILIYQLNVLTFGASCSPFISHYVRNKNAETFGQNDSEVIEAITKQHYVDDFIDSTNTVEEAIKLSKRISPYQTFTDESFRSALMEVEMMVNSRPLNFVSLETEDQEAITPNHFLLGSSNGVKPFCNAQDLDHKMCLRQSEIFANHFWRRWIKEMLPTLTRRSKWFQKVKPISEGDIVIIVDENSERNSWLKGRVLEVTTAKDGQVRRAKVQTKNGVLERLLLNWL
ncbi:uncharacterized protein [Musca autumnalis]|uniref:uncharacterized protein n=1 Tax=Musca autumnalis TaxID=221902 RepID=UPI003CF2B7FC